MEKYFSAHGIPIDIESLTEVHQRINDEIIQLYDGKSNFLKICIDDPDDAVSLAVKDFLGLDSDFAIGRENASDAVDAFLPTSRHAFFSPGQSNPIEYVERVLSPTRAMPSEYGWVYLCNDTNRFLHQQFGDLRPTPLSLAILESTLNARAAAIEDLGAKYLKIIIPEKSVVYPEYLPKAFSDLIQNEDRAAVFLASKLSFVNYALDYLRDVKSVGFSYFRGDSHTNWLGAYNVYRYIYSIISRIYGPKLDVPLGLDSLAITTAGYNGDLFEQMNPQYAKLMKELLPEWSTSRMLEVLPRFEILPAKRRATQVYLGKYSSYSKRQAFVYKGPDSAPSAVIFRDSTADFVCDYLAQHFSRSVFLWRNGEVNLDVVKEERPDLVLNIMAERFVLGRSAASLAREDAESD
jgi:hypothetical protein